MTTADGAVPERQPLGILWGLAPLLSIGLLGWLPFAVWATVHRKATDAAVAAGYAAWVVAAMALVDRPSTEDLAAGMIVALVVVCTGHTAAAGRRRPLRQSGNDRALEAARARAQRRDTARALLDKEPQVARELGIGRPDLRGSYDDGGLLDVNGVPGQVLVRELGWTEAEAADVVAVRDRIGGFSGPTELISLTGIAPTRVDVAAARLVFSTS